MHAVFEITWPAKLASIIEQMLAYGLAEFEESTLRVRKVLSYCTFEVDGLKGFPKQLEGEVESIGHALKKAYEEANLREEGYEEMYRAYRDWDYGD